MTPKAIYRVLFNRRKATTSRDGSFPIEVEAYIPRVGERKYFPTGIRVRPDQWKERDNQVSHRHPNYVKLNARLKAVVQQFEDQEDEYRVNKQPFHLKYLGAVPRQDQERYFTKWWEKYIKETNRIGDAAKRAHNSSLVRLRAYKGEVLFNDLTVEFMSDYEDHLLEYEYFLNGDYHHLKPGYIHSVFKDLRAALNVAIEKGLFPFERNPFLRFKFQRYLKYESTVKYLDRRELQAIEDIRFTKANRHLAEPRDMFLLACYTGLRFCDISQLDRSHIVEKDGGLAIDMAQQKTDGRVYIPVSRMFDRKGEHIIRTYLATGRFRLFSGLQNPVVNRSLKAIDELAGLGRGLHFHMGRHTCATQLLSLGLGLEFVKEILGHKDIATTAKYAKIMKTALDEAVEKIQY